MASPFWRVMIHLRTLKELLKKSIYLVYPEVSQVFLPTEPFIHTPLPPPHCPSFAGNWFSADSGKGCQQKPVKWLQGVTGVCWAVYRVFICPLPLQLSLLITMETLSRAFNGGKEVSSLSFPTHTHTHTHTRTQSGCFQEL